MTEREQIVAFMRALASKDVAETRMERAAFSAFSALVAGLADMIEVGDHLKEPKS